MTVVAADGSPSTAAVSISEPGVGAHPNDAHDEAGNRGDRETQQHDGDHAKFIREPTDGADEARRTKSVGTTHR